MKSLPSLPRALARLPGRRRRRWMKKRAAAPLALTLLLASSCAPSGSADTRRELLETWSTELIVPLYAEFETESESLSGALDALCAEPTDARQDAARDAWMTARETWKEAEIFAFGPYSRPGYRIGPQIDSWPARASEIEELLASSSPVDPATVSSLGIWHKGLPAIEYLLYPPAEATMTALTDARRCAYLSSLGIELVARARAMHQAWSPEGDDFAGQLSGAGRTSTAFRSLRDAFSELVNRMGFTVENIRRDKLGRPLGDEAGGTPAPEAAESRFSGRSVQDIRDNLDGIERLYFGDDSRELPGLRVYAAERGRDFDAPMRAALDAAHSALDAIAMPLTEAVVASPELVRNASARLSELQSLLQVDLIGALGLTLSFNDNDGD